LERIASPSESSGRQPAPHAGVPWRALGVIFLLALAVRLAWFASGPKVIENEGVYYARVGENLASGRGLLSIHENGKHLLYPPLYATMISLGVRAGLNAETAGRAISLVFGVAFPLLVLAMARKLYGPRAGWFAGVLAAVQPVMIVASSAVLTESTYLTLSLAAIWFVTETFTLRAWRPAAAAGFFLGLAYLCRPEAFILTGLFAVAIVVFNRDRWRLAAGRAGVMVAVFAIFAVPYVRFLYRETGQLRWEAKTADGVRYSQRKAAGQNWGQIYFAIDPRTLEEKGSTNTSDLAMLRDTHATLNERVRNFVRQGVHNLPRLLQAMGDLQLGQPAFGLCIALGFFGGAWTRDRLRRDVALLVALGLTLMTFCTWPFFHDRFLFPLLPALLVWSGAGLERLAAWARASLGTWGLGPRTVDLAGPAAVTMCLGLVCLAGASGIRESDELSMSFMVPAYREDRVIGDWIRQQGAGAQTRPRIMDTGPLVAFYGGGVLVPYPWTDSVTALRYISARNVSYLVVRQSDSTRRPYLADWFQHVPDARFELVHTFAADNGESRLYRWRNP
jgi:4-amino-4-deoxy-L-arabinose transferase-like glycosyltransferase